MSNSTPAPAPTPRYTIDGVPGTLDEIIRDNDFSYEEIARLRALPPGGELRLGGGAWAEFVVRREPDPVRASPETLLAERRATAGNPTPGHGRTRGTCATHWFYGPTSGRV